MKRLRLILITLTIALLLISVFLYQVGTTSPTLRITTTTSLYATGLLDELAQRFEKDHTVKVQIIAVGSGEALKKASLGDADLVLAHAPSLEKTYLKDSYLKAGAIFAYNTFIIVGPPADPASVKGRPVTDAFDRIYGAGEAGAAQFASRGDNSGTDVREKMIWRVVGKDPAGQGWYKEVGAGMDQTLMVANELGAYALTDEGTYLVLKNKLNGLESMGVEGAQLLNIYSVYAVNGERVKGVNERLAGEFKAFLLSPEIQVFISIYKIEKYGKPLFNPANGDPTGELMTAWNALAAG